VFSGSWAETGGEEAEYLIPCSSSQSKWSQFGHSGGNSLVKYSGVHFRLVNCMGRYPVSSTHCDPYVRSTDEPYRDPTRYGPTVTAVSSRRSAIHYCN
jgi:hypothetical protein